jgi:hypothetical protein
VAFRFALRLADGRGAGAASTFTTESDEWQPGDVLYDQERVAWRVVKVLDVDRDELRPFGVLVVEPAA